MIIEIHPDPVKAFPDLLQSLKPAKFSCLMKKIALFYRINGAHPETHLIKVPA
jgi:3-deoxy-D-arabino-heptulosonate 7-phosphate (DAHP) synthase